MSEITDIYQLTKKVEQSVRKMNQIRVIPDKPLDKKDFDDLEWKLVEYIRQFNEPVYVLNQKPQMTSRGPGLIFNKKDLLKNYYVQLLADKGLLTRMGIYPNMLKGYSRVILENLLREEE